MPSTYTIDPDDHLALERYYERHPDLEASGFTLNNLTSPRTDAYNCIAWAADEDDIVWWPTHYPSELVFWPAYVSVEPTLDNFIAIFLSETDYIVCADASYDPDYDKIVFYSTDDGKTVEHAAKQIGPDLWWSKLGRDHDVHHTLLGLAGKYYGHPCRYMRRKKADAPKRLKDY